MAEPLMTALEPGLCRNEDTPRDLTPASDGDFHRRAESIDRRTASDDLLAVVTAFTRGYAALVLDRE